MHSPPGFRFDLFRWRQLVSADWLSSLIRQQPVAAAPVADWQLFEVGCEGLADYAQGHVPGARYLDSHQFEALPFWNALPAEPFRLWLQEKAITPHSTVILYGRTNSLAAARLAHLLLVAGVEDVRLLDGGLQVWLTAGHGLEQGPLAMPDTGRVAQATATWAQGFTARPDYLRDMDAVRAHVQQQDATLVSIRSHAEYVGETSGYSYIAARGEIPGALWGHAGEDGDVNGMQSFQTPDGRMLPAEYIAKVWRDAGIGPEQNVVFYCGTGWRASLAFFYAWLMGWPRISVYDGGWMEWSMRS